MVQPFAQAYSLQCSDGTIETLLCAYVGIVHQWQLNVLDACRLWQKVVVLEDEAYLAVAENGTLCRELGHIGLAYGACLLHLNGALLISFAELKALLVHLDGFVGVQYLDINLCDLLLKGVCRDGRVELSLLLSYLVAFDFQTVLIAVSHCPVEVDAVCAVVVDLVRRCLYVAVGDLLAVGLGERVVDYILRCRGAERRKQFCL